MDSVEKQVLDILTKALSGDSIEKIENWSGVLQELKAQAVFCLPYAAVLKSGCLSKEELASYQMLCYQNIAKNTQVLAEQNNLVLLFEKENIPFVVLKGFAAARYYPHPEYRAMGDIDIIVKPEDLDRTYKVLNSEYVCIQTFDENPRHAGFMTKAGVEIELHKFFTLGKKTEKKAKLDKLIFAGIDRREWHETRGYRFPCLPTIENALVLLDHINQHLQGQGVGYRQLIDFKEFVEAEKEQIGFFLSTAETVGLRIFAEALICMYQTYMGLSGVTNMTIDPKVVEELARECTMFGNFGKKDSMDSDKRTETVLKKIKTPITFMRMLQKYGRERWKASENCVFLRPFAWCYQLLYYVKQLSENGGFSVITEGHNRLQSREDLFRSLGL